MRVDKGFVVVSFFLFFLLFLFFFFFLGVFCLCICVVEQAALSVVVERVWCGYTGCLLHWELVGVTKGFVFVVVRVRGGVCGDWEKLNLQDGGEEEKEEE